MTGLGKSSGLTERVWRRRRPVRRRADTPLFGLPSRRADAELVVENEDVKIDGRRKASGRVDWRMCKLCDRSLLGTDIFEGGVRVDVVERGLPDEYRPLSRMQAMVN
jgi:hypothetical protein